MKLGASIGNSNKTLLLEKTQKASKGQFVFVQIIRKKNITITHDIDQIRSSVLHSYG